MDLAAKKSVLSLYFHDYTVKCYDFKLIYIAVIPKNIFGNTLSVHFCTYDKKIRTKKCSCFEHSNFECFVFQKPRNITYIFYFIITQ